MWETSTESKQEWSCQLTRSSSMWGITRVTSWTRGTPVSSESQLLCTNRISQASRSIRKSLLSPNKISTGKVLKRKTRDLKSATSYTPSRPSFKGKAWQLFVLSDSTPRSHCTLKECLRCMDIWNSSTRTSTQFWMLSSWIWLGKAFTLDCSSCSSPIATIILWTTILQTTSIFFWKTTLTNSCWLWSTPRQLA